MQPSTKQFNQGWRQCNCHDEFNTLAGFLAGAVAGGAFWAALYVFICASELFQ
jgi:hypothetical protein